MARDLKTEARRALIQGAIDKFARPFDEAAKTKLKQAIIAAHSFGALTDEETANLIHHNGLEAS